MDDAWRWTPAHSKRSLERLRWPKHWNLTQGCFVPRFVEIAPLFLDKKIFKCCQHIFAIFSTWKRMRPFFFLHILELHWNWPSGSEEDFEILSLNFRYNIFLGKVIGSSFEQTWIPFTYRYFVSSLIKIGQLLCRQCIFAIISHWKGGVPLFEDTWILLGKEWCVQSLFEIGHVFICVSEDSEENILNCVYVFCYFVIIPIGKGCDPLLPNLNLA